MQVARARLTLYRLPEARVDLVAPPSAIPPVPGTTASPFPQPQPPRILAVPAERTAPRPSGDAFAETLMAIASLDGIRAYAETRHLWALWHPEA